MISTEDGDIRKVDCRQFADNFTLKDAHLRVFLREADSLQIKVPAAARPARGQFWITKRLRPRGGEADVSRGERSRRLGRRREGNVIMRSRARRAGIGGTAYLRCPRGWA
ncbi:hypothetical protein EVAR_103384_1 [Eumeta japonica]|uniref:Uncharacterized protein n=1 Tax=Eumeta variegata TaxID=151549 RepID=A0A4C1Y6G0_EUMVA|nr:hypothetical protein EVAR_103384_1 [Eumeta japonica]